VTDQTHQDSNAAAHPPAAPPVQPAPPPVVAAPPVDLATTDVLCRRCQFNLRGLTPERNCPECGFPIQRTMQGDPLVLSSPAYLRSLSTGLKWIIVATLAQLGLSLVSGVLGAIVGITSRGNIQDPSLRYLQIGSLVLGVPIAVALLIGWWRFSTPDPEIVAGDKGDTPRLVVRSASVLLIVTSLLSGVATIWWITPTEFEVGLFLAGVGLLAMIGSIAQFFASLLYVRWISRRMQDGKLVEKSTRYLWMLPLIYIVGLCVLALGPIVAMILYLLLLNDLRKGINFTITQQRLEAAHIKV
jgi:hypothetical protein